MGLVCRIFRYPRSAWGRRPAPWCATAWSRACWVVNGGCRSEEGCADCTGFAFRDAIRAVLRRRRFSALFIFLHCPRQSPAHSGIYGPLPDTTGSSPTISKSHSHCNRFPAAAIGQSDFGDAANSIVDRAEDFPPWPLIGDPRGGLTRVSAIPGIGDSEYKQTVGFPGAAGACGKLATVCVYCDIRGGYSLDAAGLGWLYCR